VVQDTLHAPLELVAANPGCQLSGIVLTRTDPSRITDGDQYTWL
jgi:hypothetical protein